MYGRPRHLLPVTLYLQKKHLSDMYDLLKDVDGNNTNKEGAKKAREVIFVVLRDACINGDLSIPEATQAAKDIFSENARHLYKIKAVSETFDSNDVTSPSEKLDITASSQDVAYVRVIWVDASGQHRCRG
ncbi:hypothetical protein ACS0TY_033300 [Phlomoides rotata]